MRIIVFFDLPTYTSEDRRVYRGFRKYLQKMGFLMMQESVYSKLVLNQTNADLVIKNIRKHKPPEGLVQILTITERQFSKIEYLVGEPQKEVIDTTERTIVI